MRRRTRRRWARALAVCCVLGCLPAALGAPSVLDFDDWMQRIDDGNQELQRRIAARDRAAALERARELEELYGLMEKFFEQRGGAAEAVRLSREGRDLASGAVKHLDAGNYAAARERVLRIAHGCRGCHIEYKPL